MDDSIDDSVDDSVDDSMDGSVGVSIDTSIGDSDGDVTDFNILREGIFGQLVTFPSKPPTESSTESFT